MRQEIVDRPGYRGGRTAADLEFSGDLPAVKLSSNELPYPPVKKVLDAALGATLELNRYPEPSSSELIRAIANRYGLSPEQIAVSNGTATIIDALMRLTSSPTSHIVYPWRTFEALIPLTTLTGMRGRQIPLASYHHDLEAMADAVSPETSFVYVCNPNNPTGTIETSADLIRFLDAVPSTTMIVLDEAYIHFTAGRDTLDGLTVLDRYPNLVILRTFSKSFGLAALRAGFAACAPEIARELRKVISPFSMTAMAAAAVIASLDEDLRPIFDERISEIARERDRLTLSLRNLGIDVVPESAANFIFLPTSEAEAQAISTQFEAHGLIVRPYADGIRISIGLPPDNDRVVDAAREIKSSGAFERNAA